MVEGVATASCNKCFYRCATCSSFSNSGLSCLTCAANRIDYSTLTPFCNCKPGYYEDPRNNAIPNTPCLACHSSCETCDGPSELDCLTCKADLYSIHLPDL